MQIIAIIATLFVVLGLFHLDRKSYAHNSRALWIPVLWMLISGSRSVTEWTGMVQGGAVERLTEARPLDVACYGFMILAGLAVINYKPRKVARILGANPFLLLFLLYCAISTLWSDIPFIAAKRFIKMLGDVVMILLLLVEDNPIDGIKQFFARTAYILMPVSVMIYLFFPNLGQYGVALNKNGQGQICMVCGIGALGAFMDAFRQDKSRQRTISLRIHGAMFITAAGIIAKIDSMTSLSCLLMAGFVLVLSSTKSINCRAKNIHALVGGVVFIAIVATVLDESGGLFQMMGRNRNLTGRTEIWTVLLSLHTNPLVGTGYESFWSPGRLMQVWSLMTYQIQEAHNGYLEVYLNLGLIGLIFLGTVVVAGYRNIFDVVRHETYTGTLFLAILVASLTYSISEAGFRLLTPIWIVFLLAVIRTPGSVIERREERRASADNRAANGQANKIRILQ
jgi:exopolysaccharide production protein ExoQ